MFYGSREEKDQKIAKTVEAYRNAASLFPKVRKVFEAFDGKVFNCRLEKALREETGARIFVNKRCRWLEIECYFEGYSSSIMLAQIKLDGMPDGKRIPADLLIQSCRTKRENLLSRAAELEESMDQIDELKRQLDYFKSQIDRIVNSIPYEARDTYNLYYRVCH